MIRQSLIVLTLFTGILFISCNKSSRFNLTQTNESKALTIIRFDSLLMHADTTDMLNCVRKMYALYPSFTASYAKNIMDTNPDDTLEIARMMSKFLKNPAFKRVNNDVSNVFKNTDSIRSDISTAYSYLNQYLPDVKTPPVYFFVSGFNRSIIIEHDFVGVGLDLYLGSSYPAYTEITYNYLIENMKPSGIAPDLLASILTANYPFDGNQERLLEKMLYNGKILYILSVILPHLPPNTIIGYSKFQWEWCRKYEDLIWEKIVGQKDLYSTDLLLQNKYVNDAPFTSPVSQESPGRLGIWVGWQIIKQYMDKNTNVTLTDLVKTNDYQMILTKSGYQP